MMQDGSSRALAWWIAVGAVTACGESPSEIPDAEKPCEQVLIEAGAVYVEFFETRLDPICFADEDCFVIDPHLVCDGFRHQPRPFAVHLSEVSFAEQLLAERRRFCGRPPPECVLERGCIEQVDELRARCVRGRCGLDPQGQCI